MWAWWQSRYRPFLLTCDSTALRQAVQSQSGLLSLSLSRKSDAGGWPNVVESPQAGTSATGAMLVSSLKNRLAGPGSSSGMLAGGVSDVATRLNLLRG
jgi:hypothetical protein